MPKLRNKFSGTVASVPESNVESLLAAGWEKVGGEPAEEKRKPRAKKE